MGAALSWLVDHTVGWVFDHTAGWAIGRLKRGNRQRDDLGALADALSEAVSECSNVGMGYVSNYKYVQKARQKSLQALALSTRVPDEEIGRLTKAAADGIGAYLDNFMHAGRATYTKPFEAVMEHIHNLQRRLG